MNNENLLREGARQIGIENLDTDAFLLYMSMLKQWGSRINLSSVLTDRAIIIRHLVDSLTAARFVPKGSSLLDVGSGAGLPGIPLFLNDPSLSVVLLESVGKKVAFLRNVKRSFGFSRLAVLSARAERVEAEMTGSFDRVIFRAVGSISYIISLATPYLDIEGEIIIMKGPRWKEEWNDYVQTTKSPAELVRSEQFRLPFSGEERAIITVAPHRRMEKNLEDHRRDRG